MSRHLLAVAACLTATVALAAMPAWATTVVVRSGNGAVGSQDSLVTQLSKGDDGPFATPFTAANFQAARTGPNAWIVTPHPAWWPSLSGDPLAQWISPNPNGGSADTSTCLFAVPFTLPGPVGGATLTLDYSVDNFLGESTLNGLYVNEVQISPGPAQGDFRNEYTFTADITALVNAGSNYLYLYLLNRAVDPVNPGGIMFSASIETVQPPQIIPEPLTGLALIGAVGSLVGYLRRRT